jgi:outer membrane immunogenic protein
MITPDTLAYATAGVAWQRIKIMANCDAVNGPVCAQTVAPGDPTGYFETRETTLSGWTVGAGVETVLYGAWTGRIEYRYSQFDDFKHIFLTAMDCQCGGHVDTDISLATHTLTAGLAFKFVGP